MPATDLVLLTSRFPFGSVSEPFLETELPLLAPYFRRVFLLPSELDDGVAREIPSNATIVKMPWLTGYAAAARRRALVSADAARVIAWSLASARDLARQAAIPKLYANVLACNVLKARDLTTFVQTSGLSDAIYYDYWFENSTLALALLRSRRTIMTALSRAHNFDIYDDRWGGRPVPFREAKARYLDAVFSVSDHGASYLARTVPSLAGKLSVRRLGVVDPGRSSPPPSPEAAPLILTCARLVPTKRIHLVPEVLAAMGRPVRWIHLGDGDERERVAQAARSFLPAGTWELRGALSNQAVLDFYGANSVQLLLSLSESEGIPVSMMEAQSFGVPIVASSVGGVPEIVSPSVGEVVRAEASAADAASAIRRVLDRPELTRESIRAEFRSKYDAESNYRGFADDILALRARTHATAGPRA